MGNQWGLGLHLIFVTIFSVATIINTCFGVQNKTVSCFEHERLALIDFKHSVQDDFKMLSTWVGDDCCMWERVQCDLVTGHVESLHLRGRFENTNYFSSEYLVGNEVKSSLMELSQLKYLDLSGNSFQGSRISEFIGSFKHLTYLNLSDGEFSGNIPHHIGNLSNLKVLDLSFNSYEHTLKSNDVAWISGLSSLKYLDLRRVDLSEAKNYDVVLYMIPWLEELHLARCGMSGHIPLLNSSETLSKMKHLDLGFNNFNGQLPGFFRNMTSLKILDISGFDLSMSWKLANLLNNIHPSLQELHLSKCSLQNIHLSPTHLNMTTLSNIRLLDLSRNSFEGKFPSVLTNLTSLRILDLSYCHLNSTIPILPDLVELDLSFNNFKQIEQVGFWRQCHLKRLTLSENYPFMEMSDSLLSECSHYDMESLYLRDSFYSGRIPLSLGKMKNLRHLVLWFNGLTGSIPESLGRLTKLRVLDLSGNELTGSIPESLGRSTKLRVLDLSRNKLTGSIPESLGRSTKLRVLDLSRNKLTGQIPEKSLVRLRLLQELYLSYNQLNGSIPVSLGSLVALKRLGLQNNQLTGPIPTLLRRLFSLQSFSVSSNLLEGIVSESHFYNLSMLKVLYLDNNKLTLNFSHDWMPPFQLSRLYLSSCKIGDEFPRWLQTQRKLQSLALSNTSISGPLPMWLRNMPIISDLDLSHNNLNGSLTNLLNGRTSYDVLILQNNLFNESIPWSLCGNTNLFVLNLSRNRLTGKIPTCIWNLKNIEFMIFSSNRLSGVIPSSIAPNSSSLNWLSLNDNDLGGVVPRELGNLGYLSVLDLGDNKFSGEIPAWNRKELSWLSVLRLHKNNFTGSIPPSLCKIPSLQIFDVAYNNITGPIPHCLGRLWGMTLNGGQDFGIQIDYYDGYVNQVMKGVELEFTNTLKYVINMDLSSNKLVGGIPTELTALTALVGLNLSNNLLTGSIPDNIGKMDALNSLDLSGNRLTGMIPPSIADLHFLSYLNLSYNNLSGRIPTGNQLQTLNDPSIYVGNTDLCGAPLSRNCSYHEDLTMHNKEANDPNKVWFYLDVVCGFATGFWGIIGVLVLRKEWRHKLFMFAEVTTDNLYVAVMVRVAKMKRQNDAP